MLLVSLFVELHTSLEHFLWNISPAPDENLSIGGRVEKITVDTISFCNSITLGLVGPQYLP